MRALPVLITSALLAACGSRSALRRPDFDVPDEARFDVRPADAPDVALPDAVRPDALFEDVRDDEDLTPVALQLDGLRWELPCGAVTDRVVCACEPARTGSTTLRAPPGSSYRVTWRLRGVAETRTYRAGASIAPHVVSRDETPGPDDAWNVYGLDVGSPAQRYFVNAGPSGRYVVEVIDEVFSLQIDAGAAITLASECVDGRQISNFDGLVVPGVPPAPAPFDGQFLQLDVLSIERTR